MKRVFSLVFAILFFLCGSDLVSVQPLGAETGSKLWLTTEIGIISPASEKILQSSIKKVRDEGMSGLILIVDTPGGSLESTRSMVKAMMAVDFPIIAWVGPAGAHAGSAGAFITMAAHVATMAAGSNIGAAHPINAFGGMSQNEKNTDKEILEEKILQDTLAFMDSIALKRGRDREVAASFISRSVSLTAEEALRHKVIDFMASDTKALMASLNSRDITLDNGIIIKLDVSGYELVAYERSVSENILGVFANPNLLYLFFIVGMTGLMWEITHPGVFFPGIIGAISLILAMVSSSVLPVSWGAMALMILGIGLMITEIFVPGLGILGVGGFVAFVLGSVFLVDPSGIYGMQVSWGTIIPGALFIAVSSLSIGYLVFKSQRKRSTTGNQRLVGRTCLVFKDFSPSGEGKVMIDGEIWNASAPIEVLPITKGENVVITSEENLAVKVIKPSEAKIQS